LRLLAALAVVVASCGGGAGQPERPEVAAAGYLAAGTVGQDPDTGAVVFTGNPLAVAWSEGELRPLDGVDGAVAAFRQARVVDGVDRRGKPVRVAIADSDPPSEGMFAMRLGGTVETGRDARAVLLALPAVPLEAVPLVRATVPDATGAEQEKRLRAALQASPPRDECGGNTYDLVQSIGAAAGARAGKGGPLAVTYKLTVTSRARTGAGEGWGEGEAMSALFIGSASSVEPPYLGLCPDHPAWRADPELAVEIAGRATFLLVITACGCEHEAWHLIGTGP
jgi:hypothetical protein